MRLARNLFLIAAAAIAMIAFSAQAANAVEVSNEPSNIHCGEVDATNAHIVSGGCQIEAETEDNTTADLATHIPTMGENVFSQCENVFNARVHESGNGYIFNQELTGANCGISACDEAAPSHARIPWPAQIMEFGGAEALQVTFCTRAGAHPGAPEDEGTGFTTCTIYIPLLIDGDHQYEFRTLLDTDPTTGRPQSRCSQNAIVSLTGHWTIHGTPIEITH
jgi:hypothetical protein